MAPKCSLFLKLAFLCKIFLLSWFHKSLVIKLRLVKIIFFSFHEIELNQFSTKQNHLTSIIAIVHAKLTTLGDYLGYGDPEHR